MAGTIEGGRAAAATNKSKYGGEFYHVIGAKGGRKGRTGGFYANRDLASHYGKLGGSISRRGQKLTPAQRARKRREFERTYEHLSRIQNRANKARQAVIQ